MSAIASFDTAEDAQKALKEGAIDFVFGDGIGMTFWLNGVTSEGCCEFRGGPYLDTKFFGEGVGIAVKKGNRQLAADPQLRARAGACQRALRGAVPALFPDELLLALPLSSFRSAGICVAAARTAATATSRTASAPRSDRALSPMVMP